MGADFDPAWAAVAPQLVTVTAAAQLAAATAATRYVPAVLDEAGDAPAPDAQIRPQAFAGQAADGRSLIGLLQGAVVSTKAASGRGVAAPQALARGQQWLDSALRTVVMDAARDATSAEIAARPRTRWRRIVTPPSCPRCAVLSADVYYWNQPMPRHPGCDCYALPETVGNPDYRPPTPREMFDRGQIAGLTQDERSRIAAGEDVVKVLNTSRDRWRERLAYDRKAESRGWGNASDPPPPGTTIHDLMARLTDRVDVLKGMRSAGIAA